MTKEYESIDEIIGEILIEEISSDDVDPAKKGRELYIYYQLLPQKSKVIVDNVLMTICGWSMKTLIAKAKERLKENEKNNNIMCERCGDIDENCSCNDPDDI